MDIQGLIASYGYLAVFVGTLLEGETVLLAAGFAAQQGLLDWRLVMAVAFAGATMGDQSAFLLGRWRGEAIIARFGILARHAPRVHRLLERFDVLLILAIRFLYGLRVAGPMIMGSSRIPLARFVVLNMIGAAFWAVAVGGTGYVFGIATTAMFGDVRFFEEAALLAILLLGLGLWLWHALRKGRH